MLDAEPMLATLPSSWVVRSSQRRFWRRLGGRSACSLFPFDRPSELPGQKYSPINNQDDSANQMGDRRLLDDTFNEVAIRHEPLVILTIELLRVNDSCRFLTIHT